MKYVIRSHLTSTSDGVINPYYSGWQGIDKIPDPPRPSIIKLIRVLRSRGYRVVVMSSRALHELGQRAIEEYLSKYGIVVDGVTSDKIVAQCYVDDRSYHYDPRDLEELGVSRVADQIMHYRPWWEVGDEH